MNGEKTRVAIVGIGCRFPGEADSAQKFQQMLLEGRQALRPIETRFGRHLYHKDPAAPAKTICQSAGLLNENLYAFDADFFEFPPSAVPCLDPQQRLLLEASYEALEDAGILRASIQDTNTGVFIGAFMQDSLIAELQRSNLRNIGPHTAAGNTLGMTANRLSYFYHLHGPSIAIDTACSSSLSALCYAFEAVRDGVCPLALCGGVNLMTEPGYMTALSKGGFLSPTSACHTFSEKADGYVRGEGVGVLVLKPLAEALKDGDPIYCEILGAALNHNGRTLGISQPSANSQIALLDAAYAAAGVGKRDVGYIEAHGTGTSAGDQAELSALAAFFSERNEPLAVGSVKTNIGHTEGAAGIASAIKAAMILKSKKIPPTLLAETPNTAFSLKEAGLEIASQTRDLCAAQDGRHYVGINSFGFGGSNAHAVLGSVFPPAVPLLAREETRMQLFTLSANHLASLRSLARRYALMLEQEPASGLPLDEICAYARTRRDPLAHRLAAVAETKEELGAALHSFSNNVTSPQVFYDRLRGARPLKTLLLFSGIDAHSPAMGRLLYGQSVAFKDMFDRCASAFSAAGGPDLGTLLKEPADSLLFRRATYVQPFYLAFQLSLAHLLKAYGVDIAGMAGHSVGELAALCASGLLPMNAAFDLCMRRSKAEETIAGNGAMLVLGVSETDARRICQTRTELSLAAINSSSTVVLSGTSNTLAEIRQTHEKKGIFTKLLTTSIAYHSAQIEAVGDQFLRDAPDYALHSADTEIYSCTLGKKMDLPLHHLVSHLWNSMRQPVLLHNCLEQALSDGYDCFIEVGAQPSLLRYVHEAAQSAGKKILAVALRKENEPEDQTFLTALGKLFTGGLCFSPRSFPELQRRRHGLLPKYAWQKTTYLPAVTTDVRTAEICGHLLGEKRLLPFQAWENAVSPSADGLSGHRVLDRNLYPAAAYLQMLLEASTAAALPAAFRDLRIDAPVCLDEADDTVFFTSCHHNRVRIHAADADRKNWNTVFSAEIDTQPKELPHSQTDASLTKNSNCVLTADAVYRTLLLKGLCYDGAFRMLDRAEIGDREAVSDFLPRPQNASVIAETLLLDGMLQTVALAYRGTIGETFVPYRIASLHRYAPLDCAARAFAVIRSHTDKELVADAYLRDTTGHVLAAMTGIRFQRLPRNAEQTTFSHHCYQTVWEELSPCNEDTAPLNLGVWQPQTDDIESECLRLNTLFLSLRGKQAAIAIVTQSAQAVTCGDAAKNYRQALLWGFCRAARLEFSNLRIFLVDTDDPARLTDDLPQLAQFPGQYELARRNGRWYGLRLARCAATAAPDPVFNGACLITGGAGALAESLAFDLAARGARGIALLGRARHPRTDTILQALHYFGIPAEFYAADVSDYSALAAALCRVEQTMPAICGVFHFAGSSKDQLLTKLGKDALHNAISAKLDGAEHLRRLTSAMDLQHFVLAGSLTGLTGNIGQSAYSAANAAYEALYHRMRAEHRPCTLAAFGALDVGMSLRPEAKENFRRHGIGLMLAADALAAMWQNAQNAVCIAQLDWTAYLTVSGQSQDAKYRNLTHPENPSENLRERLKSMGPSERDATVIDLLKNACADILKTAADALDADRALAAFGLDSLDTVMLAAAVNNTFGTSYDYGKIAAAPSIRKLSSEIQNDLLRSL